ncbi:hypothetical protein [Natronosalvus halobius]|uniref:hypothetical protein n=1 Tax=Natronosalvus halobius TaxID=2953746 RepID=UPI00209DA3EC|nr:hypothetical protein [Natronosalvus halobius]USZ73224.1 hypothetical protein NGM15_07980 [Natronosalvus halobius]
MKLHFRRATGIYLQTFPFVLLRLGIGLALGIASLLYFGAIAWIAYTFVDAGTISGWIAIVGLLVALALFVKAWRLLVRYVLYLVKAGHIAVIAHVIETGDVPSNQVTYGIEQVKANFTEASALFAVDQVVKGVIEQFNRRLLSVSNLVDFAPSLEQIVELLGRALALAATYIDEAIVAHLFVTDEDNRWQAAGDGLVLYAKTWKSVLGSTLLIVVGMYAVTGALLLALTPLAGAFGGLSTTVEFAGWLVVGAIVLTVYTGLLKPWVKTVVITTFLLESRNHSPDAKTRARIEARSEKFRELLGRADAAEETKARDGPAAPV